MRVAYFDPFAGASGDMLLGALVDSGWPLGRLREVVGRLDLGPVEITAEPVTRQGLRGTLVRVRTAETEAAAGRAVGQAAPALPHRGLADLLRIVAAARLPVPVETRVERVLRRLAEAEAAVHGMPVESVHFHEVGAVDTVVDIVGVVAGLAELEVERVACGPLPVGRGFVRAAHGWLPVPPPAVAALTRGVPTRGVDVEGELVTPTGAALLTALADDWGPQPAMIADAVGYGAGQRDFPIPNLLRLFLGRTTDAGQESLTLLETNIDDMNPELYEHVSARLFEAGAVDVWTAPITMKKGRPATLLSVLGPPAAVAALTDVLFAETTTFGVRQQELRRDRLDRHLADVWTEFGPIRVKFGYRHGRLVTASPEYESCRTAANRTGAPLKDVFDAARRAADAHLAAPELTDG